MDSLLWEEFKKWAKKNGVDLEHEDDYGAWWECYRAGAKAVGDDLKKRIEG